MEQLCYETLEKAGYTGYLLKKRARSACCSSAREIFCAPFADYWFDMANEKAGWNGKWRSGAAHRPGADALINRQEGLYTLYLRGRQNGEKGGCKARHLLGEPLPEPPL